MKVLMHPRDHVELMTKLTKILPSLANSTAATDTLYGVPLYVDSCIPAGKLLLVASPDPSFRGGPEHGHEWYGATAPVIPSASFKSVGVVEDEVLQQEFDDFDPDITPGLPDPYPWFAEKRYLAPSVFSKLMTNG